MDEEFKELMEERDRREEEMTNKAMGNLKLITKEKKIEKIQQAIMGWNPRTYGSEVTDFFHSNLYQDTTDKSRIVLEKPGISLDVCRMIYIYEDGRIVKQKESYQQHVYKKDGKWEVIMSSMLNRYN